LPDGRERRKIGGRVFRAQGLSDKVQDVRNKAQGWPGVAMVYIARNIGTA